MSNEPAQKKPRPDADAVSAVGTAVTASSFVALRTPRFNDANWNDDAELPVLGGGGGGGAATAAATTTRGDRTPEYPATEEDGGGGGGGGGSDAFARAGTPDYGDDALRAATPEYDEDGAREGTPAYNGDDNEAPPASGDAPSSHGAAAVAAAGGAGGGDRVGYQDFGSFGGDAAATGVEGGGGRASTASMATQVTVAARAEQLRKAWLAKNRYLTDEALDAYLPAGKAYAIVEPPAWYEARAEEPNFTELASRDLDIVLLATAAAAAATGDAAGAAAAAAAATKAAADRDDETGTTYEIPDSLGAGLPQLQPKDAPTFRLLLRYHRVRSEGGAVPDGDVKALFMLQNLLRVKSGDGTQRRVGRQKIVANAASLGASDVFAHIVAVWNGAAVAQEPVERHHFVELVKAVVARLREQVRPAAVPILRMLAPLLSATDAAEREEGREAIAALVRVIGVSDAFQAIKDGVADGEKAGRRSTARVIAVIAFASGADAALRIIAGIAASTVGAARDTAALAIGEVAVALGHAVTRVLPSLVPLFERLLGDREFAVKSDAAGALAQLAEATHPHGIEYYSTLMGFVTRECMRASGARAPTAFLRAFGAIVPLMAPADAQRYVQQLMPTLVNLFDTPDAELRRLLVDVVRRCVSTDGVAIDFIRTHVVPPFFTRFWLVRRTAGERRGAAALINATVRIAERTSSADALKYLVELLGDEHTGYQAMVAEGVRRVVEVCSTDALSDHLAQLLVDALRGAMRRDVNGTETAVLEAFGALVRSLGKRVERFARDIAGDIGHRFDDKNVLVRAQGATLVTRVAPAFAAVPALLTTLINFGHVVFQRMESDNAAALAAMLQATREVISHVGSVRYQPGVRRLLARINPVFANKDAGVQLQVVLLVEQIALSLASDADPQVQADLQELATKRLFHLLDAERRDARKAVARAFATIAGKVPPTRIVMMLMDNFRQQDRKIRICTSVALATIAHKCRPFMVLPFVLHAYRECEGQPVALIIRHSVLKCVRFLFEYLAEARDELGEYPGESCADFVFPLVPLLERALTETEIQHRRLATEAVRALILAVAAVDGFRDVVRHLLNLIHPNIVELLSHGDKAPSDQRLRLITAVVSVYEAARLVVDPAELLQYLLPGMTHAAAKVRDVFRRTYNLIYLGNPSALLAAYPPVVRDEPGLRMQRHELYAFI